eukprot:scaffold492886_cov19-Prasinocladus_malaysianus.AAC.1
MCSSNELNEGFASSEGAFRFTAIRYYFKHINLFAFTIAHMAHNKLLLTKDILEGNVQAVRVLERLLRRAAWSSAIGN